MTSAAMRLSPAARLRARSLAVPAAIVGLLALSGASLYLRTRALLAGFWIDEGISVGIASYPLTEIPSVLRMDGSPPLFYALLHVWISIFGSGEGETHGMSVAFAVLCVPAAFWACRTVGGTRAGWMGAVLAAVHPFLTFYAQETRMYALLALLSLLLTGAHVRAFAFGDRRFLPAVAVLGALLAYTHNWGLFLLVGSAVALAPVWRARRDHRALARDVLLAYGGLALLYLPWVPTLVEQALNTGAPWAQRPAIDMIWISGGVTLGGGAGAYILLLVGGAGLAAVLGRAVNVPGAPLAVAPDEAPRRRLAAVTVLVLALSTLLVAWLASQVSPAWATRYLAVLLGPALVLAGLGLAHARGLGIAALVLLVLMWGNGREGAVNGKSNVREVTARLELRDLGPGDLVVSPHPEQVPVLRYYLGDDFRYATSLGAVREPRVFDWRGALERLERTRPTPTARRLVGSLRSGQALVLVQPLLRSYTWEAPWTSLVRRRVVQWERALDRHPRLRRVEALPRFGLQFPPRGVRAVIYRVR
jgi:hypothetical protein